MSRLPVADRAAVRREMLDLVGRDRRAVLVVLVLHGAAAIAGLAAPWLLGRIVDQVAAGAGVATVDRLAVAIGGCVLVQALLSRYAQYAGHRFGERAVARLREEFIRKTLGLPVSVVERAGSGDLATRSSVDVSTVGTTVRDVVPTIVIASAQLMLLFGAIFLLHPMLGLVAYGIVICVGMSLLAGARFPRWYWLTFNAGTLFGVSFCAWLMFQSLYRINALCPYCMVVWAVTVPTIRARSSSVGADARQCRRTQTRSSGSVKV